MILFSKHSYNRTIKLFNLRTFSFLQLIKKTIIFLLNNLIGGVIMWTRSEVKEKGKESFKRNYWMSVIVAFIYSLFFASATYSASRNQGEVESQLSGEAANNPDFGLVLLVVLGILGVVLLVLKLIDLFVFNPLEVGCNRFFLVNQDTNAQLPEVLYAFKNNYINSVLGLFIRDIVIAIGCICFIIPGLILSYSYRMVPYILADNPSVSPIEALKTSRAMMKGQKWNCFVYDLSFIGWYILSACTLGILAVFYVNPYKYNSNAELYRRIRG